MCGRYALALRPSQIRARLQNDNMQVDDVPEDPPDDPDDVEAYREQYHYPPPRQSYNFAPGYNGLVYRADTPNWGAGPRPHAEGEEAEESMPSGEVHYKLQSMKWGLIPSWTKRNPDYGSMLKTINCRDDSLIENRGMWTTMKQRKRCVVVFQGFYEWLKKGKEKVPHYIKRKDDKMMCVAGLWDRVQYEGDENQHFTYTIITTSSNKQLNFLHDRMPVILDPDSKDLKTWLDPNKFTWSNELQSILKPYEGELEIYPVSKEVGKVGNNSPNFIIPVASTENPKNIANFFAKGAAKDKLETATSAKKTKEEQSLKQEPEEDRKTIDHDGTEDNAPLPVPKKEIKKGIKRELEDDSSEVPPNKVLKTEESPKESTPAKPSPTKKSATSNIKHSPKKTPIGEKGTQRITNFFNK